MSRQSSYSNNLDRFSIKELQAQLRKLGFKNVPQTGYLGRQTYIAVKAFQSSFCDNDGRPLDIADCVYNQTWDVLFGLSTPAIQTASSPLQLKALEYAKTEIGVIEVPYHSGVGPRINLFQRSLGLPSGSAWCGAFIYWCFRQAALYQQTINPLPRASNSLNHFVNSNGFVITPEMAAQHPEYIKPGTIFFHKYDTDKMHSGIVSSVNDGTIHTIEGNAIRKFLQDDIGVFTYTRTISSINLGFINYG